MIEIVYGLVGLAFLLAGYALGSRKPRSYRKAIVVEEFRIEEVKDVGGFPKLRLLFQEASGRAFPFEFHPAYAHHLSDELLTYSARALGPKMKEEPKEVSKA